MKTTTLLLSLAIAVGLVAETRVLAALIPTPIAFGMKDDFQGGTTMNWDGKSIRTLVPDGGPDNEGDAYMQVTAGEPEHVGAKSGTQWGGSKYHDPPEPGKNFLANGVTHIAMDLNNFGPDPLAIRLNFTFNYATRHATRDPVILQSRSYMYPHRTILRRR